jgi:regulator of sigma E protease
MEVLGTIVAFLAVLVVLVLVHELGHFFAAKRAGITVQEFGIGFPPRITSVVWHGTRYSLNWIPLGGFVKMLGEDGETEAQKMRERGLSEAAVDKAMEGAFNRKPIGVRMVVLLAGVVMNFLLAGVLFSVALAMPIPQGRGPLTVTQIQPDSPAEEVLQVGDQIVSADGRTFPASADLTAYVRSQAGEEVVLGIERGGSLIDVTVVPRQLTDQDLAQGKGAIGFSYEPERFVEVPSAGRSTPWSRASPRPATWRFAFPAAWPRRLAACSG